MNFDNHLFRVSSLPHIMPGLVSGKERYESALGKLGEISSKLKKYQAELAAIKNPDTKTYFNKEKQVEKYMDLEATKTFECNSLKNLQDEVEISEGCKTHLLDIWISREFGRSTRDIKNKYTEKGLENEDVGMLTYGVVKGWIPVKNDTRKDDGYIMGEYDFERNVTVYDNKCSWDIWTFFRNVKFIDNPRSCPYYPNMQGYMKIWNKEKAVVVYTLTDTPQKLIDQEKKRLEYGFLGTDTELQEAYVELEKNLTYSDIPINRKIIEVPIPRDEEYIELIPKCVIACRKYLNSIKQYYYDMDKE